MKFLKLLILIMIILSGCTTTKTWESIQLDYSEIIDGNKDGWNIAHYVAAYGSDYEMQLVIDNTNLIDSQDLRGNTPIIISELFNNLETFRVLVSSGSDVSIYNNLGGIPSIYLGYFSDENFKEALKVFNDREYDIDQTENQNISLLHYSIYGGNVNFVSEILNYEVDLKRVETGTYLYPIDLTNLIAHHYTDIVEFDEDLYSRKEKIIEMLESKGSLPPLDLPMQIGFFGNFFFNIYVNINSLFNRQIPMHEVNSENSHTIIEINNKEYAIVTKENIEYMFNEYNYDVEISTYIDDFDKEIEQMNNSEDGYIILANVSNHPYISNYWITYQNTIEEGFYKNFLEFYNSSTLIDPILFRKEDISEIVALKITERN